MADQATLTATNGPRRTLSSDGTRDARSPRPDSGSSGDQSPAAVISNVAGFGENLLTLTELQARLATIELRQNVGSVKNAGALLLSGLVVAVASLPVVLVGIAELLVSELAFKRGYALLIVAGTALVIAAVVAGIGGALLRRKPIGFPLTSEELSRNIQWIRTVLQHSGRPAARR
jgi:hypothetical protein